MKLKVAYNQNTMTDNQEIRRITVMSHEGPLNISVSSSNSSKPCAIIDDKNTYCQELNR